MERKKGMCVCARNPFKYICLTKLDLFDIIAIYVFKLIVNRPAGGLMYHRAPFGNTIAWIVL